MIKIIRNIFTVLFLTSILIISACAPSAPKKNRYTVTFKDYDGTVLKNEIVEEGNSATAPTDPIRYGYIFIGWDNSFENVTENKTITAQYEKDTNVCVEYIVTFKDFDGMILKEEKVIKGESATPPTTPSRVGYNFVGWDKEYTNIQNDLEIYATYETIKYNISYELNGGSMINENPSTYTIEDNFTLKNPLKAGCTFGGWYDNPEFSGNKIEKIKKGTTGNIELYAKYNPINYYITYILDGGTNNELNPNGYSVAEEVKLEAPTKEGYKFIGWEHNGEIIESIPQGTKGNIELVAKWEINKYTITFDTDGGNDIFDIEFTINSNDIELPIPVKEDYNFLGWYENDILVTDIELKDYNLLAKWELSISLDYELSSDETYYIVTGIGNVTDTDLTIPSTYKNLPIYEIGSNAFYNCDQITSLVISENIKKIGSSAFYGCFNLLYVELPNSLISIDNLAFSCCTMLIEINIPIYVEQIYNESFSFCNNLSSIVVDENNSTYDSRDNCNAIIETRTNILVCGSSYTNIPNTVTQIGAFAFSGRSYIESIEIPNSVTTIGDFAFTTCYSLVTVGMPNNLEYIDSGAFSYCDSLTNIEIPKTVLSIGDSAFEGCNLILTIVIPKSVYSMGHYVFLTCPNLTIYCEATSKPEGWDDDWNYSNCQVVWGYVNLEIYEENGQKYINLGRYPQTVVTDESIKNALSKIYKTNEFGYLEYKGKEYKQLEPDTFQTGYMFNNGNIIEESVSYYFLVEPIKWRVLEENNGTYKLLSELIIDSAENFSTTQFYESIRIINGQNIYSNNYKYSNLRAWLNGYDATSYGYDNYTNNSFLDIAFTEYEKSKINNTLVDNSIASTGSNQNIYVCDNTLDKIYLLSINDVLNNKYGFNASYLAFDSARVTLSSDYARSKYLSISTSVDNYGSGSWILRSPYDNNQNSTNIVSNSGYVGSSFISGYDGIRPALTLSLKDKTEYEVIFKDNNDNPLKIENVELGQSATPPKNTSSLGYEFIGWDKDYSNIQSELVVTGIYKPIIYTITFDTDGGDSIENIEFTVESDDLTLPIPIKEKHYFLGWYYEDKLITKTEYQNYNLVAKWELIEENVNIEIFEENGIKYTYLGRYPQTVVSDEAIINELSQIVEENEFGYIEYNGNEYKKVTGKPYTNDITFSNGNTIIKNNIYYFLVEPIKWRVNDETEGEYKLLSDIIIDDISYNNTFYNRIVYNQIIYPNNYRYSNIRAWLNGYNGNYYNVEDYTNKGFINVAFTKSEQLIIKNTFVDNELGLSKYWSENTNDKIYLLTSKDLYNTKYGFSSSIGYSISRAGRLSDYAKCLGSVVSSNYGYWWLREPSSSLNYESMAKCVFNYGYATESFVSSSYGVRPAMIITIK